MAAALRRLGRSSRAGKASSSRTTPGRRWSISTLRTSAAARPDLSKRGRRATIAAVLLIVQRLVAVDVEPGRAPGAGLARIGPDGLELAGQIKCEESHLAIVRGFDRVALAIGKIDQVALLQ